MNLSLGLGSDSQSLADQGLSRASSLTSAPGDLRGVESQVNSLSQMPSGGPMDHLGELAQSTGLSNSIGGALSTGLNEHGATIAKGLGGIAAIGFGLMAARELIAKAMDNGKLQRPQR